MDKSTSLVEKKLLNDELADKSWNKAWADEKKKNNSKRISRKRMKKMEQYYREIDKKKLNIIDVKMYKKH